MIPAKPCICKIASRTCCGEGSSGSALRAATTINAAYALGVGDEVGSLEAGKRADILVLNLSDYREIPRRIGVNQVLMALREGNFLINRKRAKASA